MPTPRRIYHIVFTSCIPPFTFCEVNIQSNARQHQYSALLSHVHFTRTAWRGVAWHGMACQCRGPLSFLAGMQPGNVAGLIELDGKAASEFGGGEGGSERIARLSKRMYDEVMLTPGWRCKARLAAGSWLLAYWPVRRKCHLQLKPHCFTISIIVLLVASLFLFFFCFGLTRPFCTANDNQLHRAVMQFILWCSQCSGRVQPSVGRM